MMDAHAHRTPGAAAPARRAAAVTPSDASDLPQVAKALYLGGGGDLAIVPADGPGAVVLKDHAPGYVPIQVRRVLATGTTAADVVALFD
jgi:hypothetical protein